jgi:hypothetical protein
MLLVAPSPLSPEPALAPFLRPPLDVGAVRSAGSGTILVCSDDHSWCPEGAATAYGLPLRLPTIVIPGGGHLDVEAGYGPPSNAGAPPIWPSPVGPSRGGICGRTVSTRSAQQHAGC